MKRSTRSLLLTTLLILAAGCARRGDTPDLANCRSADRPPRIRPDYTDVVIPPSIAPVNFLIDEPGMRFHARIAGETGGSIEVLSRGPSIQFPMNPWKRLLEQNRGRSLQLDVCATDGDGQWTRFQTITSRVANEPIDRYVTYRLVNSAYFWFNHTLAMGIYQRDVESFNVSRILHTASFGKEACMNCHTCAANRTSAMAMQLRGSIGPAMLVMHNGRAERVDTGGKAKEGLVSFISIHPSGDVAAFAALKLGFFSKNTGEPREVFEYASDLGLYRFEPGEFFTTPAISSPDYAETHPAWSGDGKHLYFCRTKIQWPTDLDRGEKKLPANYRDVRYDLMRIAYDADTGRWGDVEMLLSAEKAGKSIAQPSVSPDGRFVVFCMVDYGMWPLVRRESDLYLMDTSTREYAPMACNSDQSESTHQWSSNGRWMVFASKRKDMVFTRLYFTHIDEAGRSSKALELPQEDPAAHDLLLKVYNVPCFVTDPIPFTESQLVQAIYAHRGPPVERPGAGTKPGYAH